MSDWLYAGMTARRIPVTTAKNEPTYRTTPRPGVELGGTPRNPEQDVIDNIDRLVDWQIEKGKGW